jgi:hypothetical protein
MLESPAVLLAQGKSEMFLVNAAIMIGLSILAWTAVLLLSCFSERIEAMEEGWGRWFLTKASQTAIYGLPIQVFLRTYMDGSINMFVQLAHPEWTGLGILSFLVALLFLGYMIFLLAFFYKKIDLGRIQEDEAEYSKYSSLLLEMGTGLSRAAYTWTFIQCLKKLLTAALIVLLYSYPTIQIGLILAVNALCLLFIVLFNPYSNFIFRILALINELTGVTFMSVLLGYQLSQDPARKAILGEVVQAHLLLQIALQFLFMAYFFINLLAVLKNWLYRYLAGESPVADATAHEMMWADDSRIAEKIDFDNPVTN